MNHKRRSFVDGSGSVGEAVMHYYFDLQDGDSHYRDNEGRELKGDDEARWAVAQMLAELVRDVLPRDDHFRKIAVTVRTSTGPLLQTDLNWESKRLTLKAAQ